MPLGIVSDEEFERESDLIINRSEARVDKLHKGGRNQGDVEVPDSLRKIIGETALVESNESVAKEFGVSESSVSAYKNGATSTKSYHESDQELDNHVNNARRKIAGIAHEKLVAALDHITSEKLGAAKVKDVASIAKDMSAIVRNLEPESEKGPNVQFVFMAPRQRSEKDYTVIEVAES